MTGRIRRTALVLLGSAALACLALLQPARAQLQRRVMGGGVIINQPGMTFPDAAAAGASITLPTNNRLKKKLDAAQDYMKDEAWEKAVAILQSLLDTEEDVFVPPPEHSGAGKDKAQWVSIRSEANRLLAAMPEKGLQYYRLSYGAAARGLLEQARTNHDPEVLAQVARRYLYTDAGAEATALLATYHLDRGRFSLAAVYFERLITRQGLDKLPSATLLQAALAFHRVSAREEKGTADKYRQLEENVWKELTAQAGGRLRLGGRTVELADLRAEVNSGRDVTAGVHRHDWSMYRGNASRSAVSSGDRPFMEKRWSVPTTRVDKTREELAKAVAACERHGQAILPQFFPIAADGKLIYRTYWGLQAVDLKDPKHPCWDSLPSKWSLDALDGPEAGQKAGYLPSQHVTPYLEDRPSIFFENSVIGTLSTDNNQVYVVEDLAVPPRNAMGFQGGFPGGFQPPGMQSGLSGVADAENQNELQAYNVRSGKMVWHAGGRADRPAAEAGDKKEAADLSETFFLGPPLPMHGKLYVLTEKNQELRLVCLDAAKGDVVWVQLLANTQTKLSQDPVRRTHAAHLAYGEGILVCPTNAGMVFGVDLLSHTLVWAYDYRDKTPTSGQPAAGGFPQGGMFPGRVMIAAPGVMQPGMHQATQSHSEWKVTAPVVVQGRVVFTAPDGSAIHCVNLRDGSPVWKANRQEDDLYLGGVASDRVLIVSKKDCRGLSLADGKEVWRLSTGMPSGQGVVSDNLYYLPLKSFHASGGPAVLGIDVEKGVAGPPSKPRKKEVIPGNLLVYDGDVVSQTVDEIAIFPQLRVKRQQIDELIGKNPEDPVGLTERGELRLAQNELQGAVDDLRTALRRNPPAETREKARRQLYEALREYLKSRFADAEKYLDEFKALCTVEVDPSATPAEKQEAEKETRHRKADYLCLLAEGREGQGRLNEAFQCYLEFGALSDGKELLSVVSDPTVQAPAEVWARGRINAMMARATPPQRAPLEKLLARRWDEVRGTRDLEAVRKFAAMFGSQFAVGREARLYLAEKLMEEPGTASLLEAERQLLLLRGQHEDRLMAARAVETLARLMARKGLLEDAAYYYRVLGRDFADVPVRDGKTGADLLNELATDKRFLPYIDEAGPAIGGKFTGRVETAGPQQPLQAFTFEPAEEVVPYFSKYRVALDLNFHKFRLIDRQTNESVMEKDLTRPQAQGQFPNVLFQVQMSGNARFPYQTVGHAIILNLGETVCAVDPVNRGLLWEKNLAELGGFRQGGSIMVDPRDGTLQMVFPDGWVQHLGQLGTVQPSYVCLQTREGLLAVDPLTGNQLWTRSDVSPATRLFGDDRYIYLVNTGPQGNVTSTRALRASDGAWAREVPDFAEAYQQRHRVLGGRILASDTSGGKVTLRLYDVPTGKDVWKRQFAVGSIVLHSEDPGLGGVVEPDGKVCVIDLRTQKEVLRATLDPKPPAKAQGISLLADRSHYYLAVNGPRDPSIPWPQQTNFLPGSGLRCLPVSGHIFAFSRDTGQFAWSTIELPPEMLVLDQFQDLPILLCTSRYQVWQNAGFGRNVGQKASLHAFDKRTGKIFYRVEDGQLLQQMFHSFTVDLREGKFELLSYAFRVVITRAPDSATADAGTKDSDEPGAAKP